LALLLGILLHLMLDLDQSAPTQATLIGVVLAWFAQAGAAQEKLARELALSRRASR
jgi:hypothetical protein